MEKRNDKWDRTRLTLIKRLADRDDHQSWGEFVDLYWRRLYAVALSQGLNDAEAKDAVQETMAVLSKDIQKYDSERGHFTPWLLQCAKWRITEQLRKRRHQLKHAPRTRTRTGTDMLHSIPDEASLKRDELLEEDWRKYLFDLAVDKVKHKVKAAHYQIFDLLILKGLPVAEVSAITGVIPETIYTIKHRISNFIEEDVRILEELAP